MELERIGGREVVRNKRERNREKKNLERRNLGKQIKKGECN